MSEKFYVNYQDDNYQAEFNDVDRADQYAVLVDGYRVGGDNDPKVIAEREALGEDGPEVEPVTPDDLDVTIVNGDNVPDNGPVDPDNTNQ